MPPPTGASPCRFVGACTQPPSIFARAEYESIPGSSLYQQSAPGTGRPSIASRQDQTLHCEQNNGRASVDRLVRQSAGNRDGRISSTASRPFCDPRRDPLFGPCTASQSPLRALSHPPLTLRYSQLLDPP